MSNNYEDENGGKYFSIFIKVVIISFIAFGVALIIFFFKKK
jgi:hypothetical protein